MGGFFHGGILSRGILAGGYCPGDYKKNTDAHPIYYSEYFSNLTRNDKIELKIGVLVINDTSTKFLDFRNRI